MKKSNVNTPKKLLALPNAVKYHISANVTFKNGNYSIPTINIILQL